jgi:hypothetical protein
MAAVPKRSQQQLEEHLAALLDRKLFDGQGLPVDDRTADEVLASTAAIVLRGTLRGRSSRGLGGWHTEKKKNAKYREELLKQFREANSVEVLRLAAIILAREQLLGPDA